MTMYDFDIIGEKTKFFTGLWNLVLFIFLIFMYAIDSIDNPEFGYFYAWFCLFIAVVSLWPCLPNPEASAGRSSGSDE
jgi:hypothetical protein